MVLFFFLAYVPVGLLLFLMAVPHPYIHVIEKCVQKEEKLYLAVKI